VNEQTLTDTTVAPRLRRGLLWLAGLTIAGLAVELALERHWTQPVQLIAWAALAIAAGGLLLMLWSPSARQVQVARILAILVMVSALFGVWEHVESNWDAGPLDRNYSDTWDTLSSTNQWWLAITKTVGPSPVLAPGALAQVGLSILLATVRHPSLGKE
jgi:hypothetical protein